MRIKTIVNPQGERHDKPEFSIKAVREVILNSLVHRDYSIHTEGTPITIRMFSDRMEVKNKGGLYGRISIDPLGKMQAETRNPALANMLELLKETENRYSGIPTIRREMAAAGLPAPVFSVINGEFKVTLKNNFSVSEHTLEQEHTENNSVATPVKGLEKRDTELLLYCKTPRTRDDVVSFMGLSRFHTMSRIVKPLLACGALKMSVPDKPKSPKQRYYS